MGAISDKFRNPFFGDINFDGIVNIDIVILMNMILEIEEINSNADINNDGFYKCFRYNGNCFFDYELNFLNLFNMHSFFLHDNLLFNPVGLFSRSNY